MQASRNKWFLCGFENLSRIPPKLFNEIGGTPFRRTIKRMM
jgi:hypothetical protein